METHNVNTSPPFGLFIQRGRYITFLKFRAVGRRLFLSVRESKIHSKSRYSPAENHESPCKQRKRKRKRSLETYCGLVTLTAFDDMLIPLAGNVYHRLTNSAGDHRHAALDGGLVRWRQLVRPDRGDGVHIGLRLVWNDRRGETGWWQFSSAAIARARTRSRERAVSSVPIASPPCELYVTFSFFSSGCRSPSLPSPMSNDDGTNSLPRTHDSLLLFDRTAPGASMTRMTKYEFPPVSSAASRVHREVTSILLLPGKGADNRAVTAWSGTGLRRECQRERDGRSKGRRRTRDEFRNVAGAPALPHVGRTASNDVDEQYGGARVEIGYETRLG